MVPLPESTCEFWYRRNSVSRRGSAVVTVPRSSRFSARRGSAPVAAQRPSRLSARRGSAPVAARRPSRLGARRGSAPVAAQRPSRLSARRGSAPIAVRRPSRLGARRGSAPVAARRPSPSSFFRCRLVGRLVVAGRLSVRVPHRGAALQRHHPRAHLPARPRQRWVRAPSAASRVRVRVLVRDSWRWSGVHTIISYDLCSILDTRHSRSKFSLCKLKPIVHKPANTCQL